MASTEEIVKELRWAGEHQSIRRDLPVEAADEIERLRDELGTVKASMAHLDAHTVAAGSLDAAMDEIERLRAAIKEMLACVRRWLGLLATKDAEISRGISKMKSEPIGDTGFSVGPHQMFLNCQRLARRALANPRKR